ncbi:MAG: SMC family ATPase, partial [Gemmataceae bacterium]|nr:SMC family ATPase [Gemmataceae bacterium]
YGQHRGGGRNASELIHKAADSLSVDFEFELEGRWYRMRRTVSRRGQGRTTQQIWEWQNNEWQAVPDTQRRDGFERWVLGRIGLTYDAFTSSVLLLQGRAEKLLDSTPKGRAEVLAQIVDLSRYQRLFELADAERKKLKSQADALQLQLAAIPDVTTEEIARAKSQLDERQRELDRVVQIGRELSILRVQALNYSRVCQKRAANLQRLEAMESLLAQRESVIRDWERWKLLAQAVPLLESIMKRRADIKDTESRRAEVQQQIAEYERQLEIKSKDRQTLARKHSQIEAEIHQASQKLDGLEQEREQLTEPLELVQKLELLHENLARLKTDLASVPADLTTSMANTQRELAELSTLERGMEPLQQFVEAREQLRQASAEIESLTRQLDSANRALKDAHDAVDETRAKAVSVDRHLQGIRERVASCKAMAQQAANAFRDFDSLEGAKTCRLCGQPLTPEHLLAEREARQKAWHDAEAAWRQARQELTEAEVAFQKIAEELARQERELKKLQDEQRALTASSTVAKKDVERSVRDCQRLLDSLPEPFRSRVVEHGTADWAATTFPSQDDLQQLRRLIRKIPEVRRKEEELRDLQLRANRMTLELERCQSEIESVQQRLRDDPQRIRARAIDLDRDIKALKHRLEQERSAERECREQLNKLSDAINELNKSTVRLKGDLSLLNQQMEWLHEQVATARDQLPEDWRRRVDQMGLADVHRFQVELSKLKEQRVEEQFDLLQRAGVEIESVRQTLREIESEIASIPESARRDPAEIDQEIEAAARAQKEAAVAVERARDAWRDLESKQQQRLKWREELAALEVEHLHAKTLAELLGRDRLQRDLVRRAERQIVDLANAILDRLSGGTIYLRIVGEDAGSPADQALQLEAVHRTSGDEPIAVAFLSGSQKFRVAVSLALAMGQFAGQSHRPIESIIIDEGFGCLDREGRQAMIQELHQLRGLLRCILLVSHQEEFASAFTDGYHFELANGSTVARRVRR